MYVVISVCRSLFLDGVLQVFSYLGSQFLLLVFRYFANSLFRLAFMYAFLLVMCFNGFRQHVSFRSQVSFALQLCRQFRQLFLQFRDLVLSLCSSVCLYFFMYVSRSFFMLIGRSFFRWLVLYFDISSCRSLVIQFVRPFIRCVFISLYVYIIRYSFVCFITKRFFSSFSLYMLVRYVFIDSACSLFRSFRRSLFSCVGISLFMYFRCQFVRLSSVAFVFSCLVVMSVCIQLFISFVHSLFTSCFLRRVDVSCVRPFVRSFVRYFVSSLVRPFARSLVRDFVSYDFLDLRSLLCIQCIRCFFVCLGCSLCVQFVRQFAMSFVLQLVSYVALLYAVLLQCYLCACLWMVSFLYFVISACIH